MRSMPRSRRSMIACCRMRWRRLNTPRPRNVALEQAARIFNQIGFYQWMRADLTGARPNYERALAIAEKAFGPDHPQVAIRVNNLGTVLKDQGDLEGARKNFERALAIDEKGLWTRSPQVATCQQPGRGAQGPGRPGRRAEALRAGAGHRREAFGPDHPNVAIRVNNLGAVLQGPGRPGGRAQELRAGAGHRREGLRPRSPQCRHPLSTTWADVLHGQGRPGRVRGQEFSSGRWRF